MLSSLWGWLKGKKTYIAVFSYVLIVFVEKGLDMQIPGIPDVGDHWFDNLFVMLGIGGLRAAKPKA